jgi:hypothetical protein
MAVDPNAVAEAFLGTYKGIFSTANADAATNLYGDDSVLNADGSHFKGKAAIGGYIASRFAAGPVAIRESSKSVLPSMESGGIIVFITGDLKQGAATVKFQQVFTLFPTAAGSLYVRNDIFRTGPGTSAVVNAAGGDLAESFVRQYFEIYDKDRRGLAAIYRDSSSLIVEGSPMVAGAAAIIEKLSALPGAKHSIDTLDSQQVKENVTLVLVTGKLVLEGQENPLMFTQSFALVTDAAGAYVANDLFSLNYA